MKKLLDGIWTWSVWKQGAFRDVAFNGYYLELGNERVLIDPPPLTSWDLEHVDALGVPTQVIITNAHHLRAGGELAERFGAGLHVPSADAERLDCAGARTFADGDELFGLAVVGLQDQKTGGESALHWAERKILIVGDALIGSPAGALCLLPDAKFADVAAARAGLTRLAELEVDHLLPGDGAPILGRASEAIETFLGGGAPEAPLIDRKGRLVPDGPGWFVLNLGDARWMGSDVLGEWSLLESARAGFDEVGVNVTVLQPGQAASRYHRESTQEGFLVLRGACTLVIEEQERTLKAWDFVHCPPGTAHVFVGAGDEPCAILMFGARSPDSEIEYPASAAAARFGASVAKTCTSAEQAYAGLADPVDVEPRWPE